MVAKISLWFLVWDMLDILDNLSLNSTDVYCTLATREEIYDKIFDLRYGVLCCFYGFVFMFHGIPEPP